MALAVAGPLDGLDQVFEGARAEVPVDRSTRWTLPMPVVHSDGSEWVLVLRGEADTLELSWYDAGLEPVDATLVEAPRGVWVRDWVQDGDAVFVMLDARGPRDVWVLELPIRPGALGLESFDAPRRFSPAELVVDGQDLYMRGQLGLKTAVLHGKAGTDGFVDPLLLPELPRKVGLGRMAPSAEGGIEVVVHELRKRRRGTWLAHAEDGAIEVVQELRPEPGEPNLISAQRLEDADGRLIVGTYAPDARSTGATGLYVARFGPDGREWMQTHPFSEMEGFFTYLSDRASERMTRKAERRAAKGRPLDLGYSLVVHDLLEVDGAIRLVAEAFVPVYRTETRTETSMVNGVMVTRVVTTQVFAGWKHTHALAAELGRDGTLHWAHTFAMGDRLYPTLKERVAVGVEPDGLTLRYASGARLLTKRITGGIVDTAREEERLTGGEVLAAWETGAAPWGEAFLLWGRQRVVDEEGRRRVFFLARIED